MKKLTRNTLYATLLLIPFLFSACAGHQINTYQGRTPALVPQEFFNGKLTAHGVVKNRSGEVTRTFNATINADWKENVGTLEEVFLFDDGEVQYRTWKLVPSKDGNYKATAGDVIGEGIAGTSGNAMNLNYVLRIKYNEGTLDLSVDDWMFLVDENTVINESVLTKWGFRVASIQLAIIKTH